MGVKVCIAHGIKDWIFGSSNRLCQMIGYAWVKKLNNITQEKIQELIVYLFKGRPFLISLLAEVLSFVSHRATSVGYTVRIELTLISDLWETNMQKALLFDDATPEVPFYFRKQTCIVIIHFSPFLTLLVFVCFLSFVSILICSSC